jgi:hypothetical protein
LSNTLVSTSLILPKDNIGNLIDSDLGREYQLFYGWGSEEAEVSGSIVVVPF